MGDASCYVEEPTSMKFYSGKRINIPVSNASAAMKFSVLLGVDNYLAIHVLTNTRLIVKRYGKKEDPVCFCTITTVTTFNRQIHV